MTGLADNYAFSGTGTVINHGLYTDTVWAVPVTFKDTTGAVINLTGHQYVAEIVANGSVIFSFRSSGAASNEGTLDLTNAATGVIAFNATIPQHSAVKAGLYRVHLKRDLVQDAWLSEGTILIGDPGAIETYLLFDDPGAESAGAMTYAQQAAASAASAVGSAGQAAVSATAAASSATAANTSKTAAEAAATAAAASQTAAAGSASSASTSASTASAAASTATTKAVEASASATSASGSASTATSAASTATGAASTASTKASEASVSAAAAAASQAAAATSAAGAATSEANINAAYGGIGNILVKADEAAASATAAAGSASSASTSAAQSAASALIASTYSVAAGLDTATRNAQAAASLAQGYAASASSVVQQDLSGIAAQALHRSPNAITAMAIYDTSKDSDGGAWTKKCQQTSWYNEALAGKWLGAQDSEILARAVGATTGAELVTNGNFDSATGWTQGTGWSIANGVATKTAGTASDLQRTIALTAGKSYLVTFTLVRTAGNFRVRFLNGTLVQSAAFAGNGTYTVFFTALSGNDQIAAYGDATFAGSVDNISVKEVTALNTASNDYFQLSTDGKFYRLWRNILTNPNTFTNYTYPSTTTTFVANSPTVTAPDGTNTATEVIFAGGAGNDFAYRSQAAAAGTTFSVWMRTASGTRTVGLRCWASLQVVSVTVTTTWQRFSITLTAAESTAIGFDNRSGGLGGNGSAGSIFVANAQLEYGPMSDFEAKATGVGSTTEIFRGNKAEFPKQAAIVAEALNVTIYDLTEPGRPMWMRFLSGTNKQVYGSTVSCVSALNGLMVTGAFGSPTGLSEINFAKDASQIRGTGGLIPIVGLISTRNDVFTLGATISGVALPNATINAVAMTVLPDAPIDPATGLRVPTIVVATGGGVSVIKHNGTVVNSSNTTSCSKLGISKDNRIHIGSSGNGNFWHYTDYIGNLAASFAFQVVRQSAVGIDSQFTNTTALTPTGVFSVAIGGLSPTGVQLLKSPQTVGGARTAQVRIAPTYNTGWMTGDIRRCFLSDATVESVIGVQLVTSTATVSGGWTESGGIVTAPGTGGSTDNVSFALSSPTIAGRFYEVNIPNNMPGGSFYVDFGTGSGSQVGALSAANQRVYLTCTAPGSVVRVGRWTSTPTGTIGPITVREVASDRSYKASGAAITGTLTKAQLATGTSLVGYSGWSASNYLREPYSSDLDFGTGEWTASAWVNIPATLPAASTLPVFSTELVSNGDFSGGSTGWNAVSPWSISGGAASHTGASTSYLACSTLTTVAGRAYRLTFDVVSTSGGELAVFDATAGTAYAGYTAYTTGTKTVYFVASSSGGLRLYNRTAAISIDNVSVREVSPMMIADRSFSSGTSVQLGVTAGGYLVGTAFDGTTTRTVTTTAAYNNAAWVKARVSYTTDGSLVLMVNGREVARTAGTPLSGVSSKYNLLTYTEQFDNAVWTKSFSSVTADASVAPNGTTTADKLVDNATTNVHSIRQTATVTGGTRYTLSVYAKASGRNWLVIDPVYPSVANNPTYFDLQNGVVGTNDADNTASITSVGNGWYLCQVSHTTQSAQTSLWFQLQPASADNAGSYLGNGTDGVLIWGAQIELGSTVRPYQRVGAASDYDFQAPLTIGNSYALNAPFPGSIALLKLGATVPTTEQAQFMYEAEKQMFRAGAQSILPDTGAIVDMAYDDATDRWVAVSAANESYWTGLVRNSVTAVPAGSYSKIVAGSGIELVARSTTNPGVDVSIPAYGLREELVKRAEAAARLGKEQVALDYVGGFTATTTTGSAALTSVANLSYPVSYIGAQISGTGIPAGATIVGVSGTTIYISAASTANGSAVNITFLDFKLPAGLEAKEVCSAGAVKQEGSTKDYTRLYDGFIETIRFGTAPGVTAWVQIKAQRITLQ